MMFNQDSGMFDKLMSMEHKDIIERVAKIETKLDWLHLMEDVRKATWGHKGKAFTIKQLNYYAYLEGGYTRYTQFEIPKKSGGSRQISAPDKNLKRILRCINIILQAMYEPAKCVAGFLPGRSIAYNAEQHLNRKFVFNIDLKDFFPSIEKHRVWKCLTLPPFNLPSDVANMVASLCSMKVGIGEEVKYILPQGAPTSPIITNIVCRKLDRRLMGVAKRFNLTYSRYADDITFSSDYYHYGKNGDFMKELYRIISELGFKVNEDKVRLQRAWERQEVTGLIVSNKINVSRKYVRNLRQLLYIWETYGVNDAVKSFNAHYNDSKIHIRQAQMEKVIDGKLMYLKMIKGESDCVYQKMQKRFDKLKTPSSSKRSQSLNTIDKILDALVKNDFDLSILDRAM